MPLATTLLDNHVHRVHQATCHLQEATQAPILLLPTVPRKATRASQVIPASQVTQASHKGITITPLLLTVAITPHNKDMATRLAVVDQAWVQVPLPV